MALIIDSLDEDASLLLESPLMTPHQGEHGLLGLGAQSISGPCWKHLFIQLPFQHLGFWRTARPRPSTHQSIQTWPMHRASLSTVQINGVKIGWWDYWMCSERRGAPPHLHVHIEWWVNRNLINFLICCVKHIWQMTFKQTDLHKDECLQLNSECLLIEGSSEVLCDCQFLKSPKAK